MKWRRLMLLACGMACLSVRAFAGEMVAVSDGPAPSLSNVPYGAHPRQVLDFYKARSDGPTPVLFFIHGGAWMTGDKAKPDFLELCLRGGISVVSINYRLIGDATDAGVSPPVKWPLEDAARALQFVRSQAERWQIDPKRVAACGGSAGGFSALWLAMSPDRADPRGDLIARQSTRVRCVLAFVPQTTLDPRLMRQWLPNMDYGAQAFALGDYEAFLRERDRLLPEIEKVSPMNLASKDDPPVYLFYGAAPEMGRPQPDPCHSANQGVPFAARLRELGVPVELNYPNAPDVKQRDLFAFIRDQLIETRR